jgi:hypothetical protein
MWEILNEYQVNPTTWVCLSSLIMVAVYFKFRRFWSVRNVDLIGLMAFSPGLLLLAHGLQLSSQGLKLGPQGLQLGAQGLQFQQLGYVWLFVVGAFFLVRLLIDPLMVRRPMLEPNLSASGLTFACLAMLAFLVANVVTQRLTESEKEGARWAAKLLAREDSPEIHKYLAKHGPGYPLFFIFSTFSTSSNEPAVVGEREAPEEYQRALRLIPATRTTATLAHLAVVLGMILIGYRHFDNIQTGVAAATLYLLLPYTASYATYADHAVPAALMVWAVQCYRRPVLAGMLLGLAAGVIYYPLFMLPLWCSFYWRRGLVRFVVGVAIVLLLLTGSLAFTSSSVAAYLGQLRQMFGVRMADATDLTGFWTAQAHDAAFRWPVIAAFAAMCAGMALWPAQKNLGTLLSCSAAIMLAAQFWKPQDGGVAMGWYLPLLILTIFRPNLEDRIALSAVSEGWFRRRKASP